MTVVVAAVAAVVVVALPSPSCKKETSFPRRPF